MVCHILSQSSGFILNQISSCKFKAVLKALISVVYLANLFRLLCYECASALCFKQHCLELKSTTFKNQIGITTGYLINIKMLYNDEV